nr:unique cartilage matrix-associated protein isoform X2 [Microcebus murinus]
MKGRCKTIPAGAPSYKLCFWRGLPGAKNISGAWARSCHWKAQPGPLPLSPSGILAPASLPSLPPSLRSEDRLQDASSALWCPDRAPTSAKMTWRRVLLLSCLSAVVLLAVLREGTGASVGTRQAAGEEAPDGVKQKIFMQESDASNFLKRRGKRSPPSKDEVNAPGSTVFSEQAFYPSLPMHRGEHVFCCGVCGPPLQGTRPLDLPTLGRSGEQAEAAG